MVSVPGGWIAAIDRGAADCSHQVDAMHVRSTSIIVSSAAPGRVHVNNSEYLQLLPRKTFVFVK